jgi:hypothetical protein
VSSSLPPQAETSVSSVAAPTAPDKSFRFIVLSPGLILICSPWPHQRQ